MTGPLNPKPNLVLYGIIGVLALVIVVLLFRSNSGADPRNDSANDQKVVAQSGQTLKKEELSKPTVTPAAIGETSEVKKGAQVGKTYRVRQKIGFAAKGRDLGWHNTDIVKIGMLAEFVFTREIESNDGSKIVEIRTYETHQGVKILADAADFQVDPGQPRDPSLFAVSGLSPGKVVLLKDPGKVIDAVVRPDPNVIKNDPKTKVFAFQNPLANKKCRITTIDGKGVVSVEPIGCTLNAWERDHLFNKDPLANSRILKSFRSIQPGSSVRLPGSLFHEILDGIDTNQASQVTGEVVIHRESSSLRGSGSESVLKIHSGESELKLTTVSANGAELVTFKPEGMFRINDYDHVLREASLEGPVRVEEYSRKGLMEGATFVEEPSFKMTYYCEIP